MEPLVLEWLNLLLRAAHVVAAIMWIGDSFLFMWMDSHLAKPERPREGDLIGELWMAHGGGFYELVKRKSLATLPTTIYSFKWESYTTWITGVFLLTIVYYVPGTATLLDVSSPLPHGTGVVISLGVLAGGVGIYHLLCMTPLVDNLRAIGAIGLIAICGLAYGLGHVFAPRAVFLLIGAMLGSIMSSNVLLRIIPAQREMVAATREGRAVDTSFGARAKQRSTHNHYLTLPVLFTMLSNHLPALYGHPHAWLVLGLISVFAVGAKVFMNQRSRMHPVQIAGAAGALMAVAFITAPPAISVPAELAQHPKVTFATVQSIMTNRCVVCHAAHPVHVAFKAPPMGVSLETPAEIRAQAERIYIRSVHTKTMPLANMTIMSDEERVLLGAWIAQGADLSAAAPPPPVPTASPAAASPTAASPTAASPTAASPTAASPAGAARELYATRCSLCHGPSGNGDGPATAALTPKPRAFSDAAWQETTSDDALRKTILGGGVAVGKSPLMPASPDLDNQPEVLSELVKIIRGFRR